MACTQPYRRKEMRTIDKQTYVVMQSKLTKILSSNTNTVNEIFSISKDLPEQLHTVLYLFGNKIAAINHNSNRLFISNAGYRTNTTQARLNALGAGIYQKEGKWFWKDEVEFPNNVWVELVE